VQKLQLWLLTALDSTLLVASTLNPDYLAVLRTLYEPFDAAVKCRREDGAMNIDQ